MDFLPDISFSLNSWFLCTYQDGHRQSPNSNSHEHLVDAPRWHSHPDMIKALWEALGLLFSHLLFSISSPDGVTYSPIFMQVTHMSLCNQIGREALIDWTHQYFTRTGPSSQPGDQQNRKQLIFFPRTFYQGLALRAYLNGTRALRRCGGTPVKWIIPLPALLAGREPFYWARTNSQDFTYTVSLNPHNTVKLVVFLLT